MNWSGNLYALGGGTYCLLVQELENRDDVKINLNFVNILVEFKEEQEFSH